MGEGLRREPLWGKMGLLPPHLLTPFHAAGRVRGGSSKLGKIWQNTIWYAPGKQSLSLGEFHGFLLHGDAGA